MAQFPIYFKNKESSRILYCLELEQTVSCGIQEQSSHKSLIEKEAYLLIHNTL